MEYYVLSGSRTINKNYFTDLNWYSFIFTFVIENASPHNVEFEIF